MPCRRETNAELYDLTNKKDCFRRKAVKCCEKAHSNFLFLRILEIAATLLWIEYKKADLLLRDFVPFSGRKSAVFSSVRASNRQGIHSVKDTKKQKPTLTILPNMILEVYPMKTQKSF